MIKSLITLGVFCLILRINANSPSYCSVAGITYMLVGRVTGFSMMLPLGGTFCNYCFGGKQQFRQTASVVVRRMTTTKSSHSTDVDTGAPPRDTSSRSDDALSSLPANLKTWFDISLPEGRCIGVETTNETACFPHVPSDGTTTIKSDHWIHSTFHPAEVEFGMNLKETRNSFWLGRLAIRIALDFRTIRY